MKKSGLAEKRIRKGRQVEKAVYEDILNKLKEASKLEKAGNKEEADVLIESVLLKLNEWP